MTCSRVIIINKGRIEASDTPANLLKRLRTAGGIRLELKISQEAEVAVMETLGGLAGVRDVQPLEPDSGVDVEEGWRRFSVRTEAGSDLREDIYRLAVERGWTLRELSAVRATLEDVFVEMTRTD
jgi:ABC-2 type transport system ATP-binding protein